MDKNKIYKDDVDSYLSQLFEELRKREKNSYLRIDIFIMGGSAIMINNSFRDSTTDVDAYIRTTTSLSDSIKAVAGRHNLPDDWLNTNVTVTQSFTRALLKYCTLYHSFGEGLNVYVISNLAQVCMKLVSFRQMSLDSDDIRSIVKHDKTITYDQIMAAIEDIYGDDSVISVDAQLFIYELLNKTSNAIADIANRLLGDKE